MKMYFAVLNKYAVFSGRARRTEYWMFTLFNIIISLALGFIEGIVGIAPETEQSVLGILYGAAVLIPGMAVGVRRLHDTGRSGWWCLILLIPIIGWFLFIVWAAQDSHPGENKYGPNPKLSSGEDLVVTHSVCPFCAEEIKAAAIVCKHCGRDLPGD